MSIRKSDNILKVQIRQRRMEVRNEDHKAEDTVIRSVVSLKKVSFEEVN